MHGSGARRDERSAFCQQETWTHDACVLGDSQYGIRRARRGWTWDPGHAKAKVATPLVSRLLCQADPREWNQGLADKY
jgi:hypothetical protein